MDDFNITWLVHVIHDLRPYGVVEHRLAVLDVHTQAVDVRQSLLWVLFSQIVLQELANRTLDGQLHVSELLIHFVPQHLSKEEHLVVLMLEARDGLDDGGGLVNDDALQAVLLVQVGVEVLLHGFPSLVVHVDAFVVVLHLL